MIPTHIEALLQEKLVAFNQPDFIKNDPISLAHLFSKPQDREIIGFWVCMLAWGQRISIINSGKRLIQFMDGAPFDFIRNHQESDRKRFLGFKHRTFNDLDALYFLTFLQYHYLKEDTLETAFSQWIKPDDITVEQGLVGFNKYFFSLPEVPSRTRKHVASPERNSACKRINMFLRWMVRCDGQVDLGIWTRIKPSQLVCPLDVHVDRVGRKLGLLTRTQSDWKAALELTENLRKMDPNDPVKYDFALFGLGLEGF